MHVIVEVMITWKKDLVDTWYYSNNDTNRPEGVGTTIIIHEELAEQLRWEIT